MNDTHRRATTQGALLILAATIVWGVMFPVGKAALASVDAFFLTAIRYGVASLIFIAILAALEGRRALSLEGKGLKVFLYGSAGFAGFSLLVFGGLAHARAEHGAIIMALQPLIGALLNWVINRERPSLTTAGCIVAAFVGVFLVVTKGGAVGLAEDGHVFGNLLMLTGAACWVVYTMGARSVPAWSPLRYTTLSAALGTVTILIATFAATQLGYAQVPALATVWSLKLEFFYLIVISAVMSVLFWNAGVKRIGALNGILFINLVPVTAFAVGLFQGHVFSAAELAGALITIVAVVVNNLSARRLAVRAAAASQA